ncbi:FtsX-like permease family protein [Streptomyces sp. YS415]|uniref:FtsX-like permease family protein n=1 Tax=Streptomyces sp. YS415 TaxID=2944806 RepID=UPI002020AE8F|nr:FtsX-like permease family protein [Streptomyces sp. YS415]MCL7425439.1 FtsX-like permease family protein [Streptomyces sp. YS415]
MWRLSWASFTERWTLFVGAALSVCLGVALVQSSLLLLLSAATLDAPAGTTDLEAMDFDQRSLVAVTVVAVMLGCAAFLAVFIISSTFAFTVAQRRRDLAMLRLTGATPRQVRGLLLGQATLLGLIGVAGGVPLGVAVIRLQEKGLRELEFVPAGFSGQWHGWVVLASAGTGLGLALTGVLLAARRAARIRPLEALRQTREQGRSLGRVRSLLGALFLIGSLVLVVLAPLAGPAGGQAMAMCVSICAVLALACFGPVVVPALVRLLPARADSTVALLAKSGLRDDVWRSAATAAPVVVLVGLLLGQAVAFDSAAAAAAGEQRRATTADLVVEARGDVSERLADVAGVTGVSTELDVPVAVTTGSGDMAFTELHRGMVIRPDAYSRLHPRDRSLADLRGRAVAAGPGAVGIGEGDRVGVRVGGADLGRVTVAEAVPPRMGGGASLLIPAGLLASADLESAASRSFIAVERSTDVAEVEADLSRIGTVSTVSDWAARDAEARASANAGTLTAVMGLGGLFAFLGIVNTVVMAVSDRRTDFAAARVTGFTRSQILASAALEATAITAIGLVLGAVATAGTLIAMAGTAASVTGSPTVAVPWSLAAGLGVACLAVTGLTGVSAAWIATGRSPVSLLAARE